MREDDVLPGDALGSYDLAIATLRMEGVAAGRFLPRADRPEEIAARHGFRFVGIEQDPAYFDIACRRVAAAVEAEEAQPSLERVITKAVRAVQLNLIDDMMRGT